uniref:Uncharacterized protein n=1 Tax=Anguilla anguilla TaxID=7936 RepID=A0A0E9XIM7_ANGAN
MPYRHSPGSPQTTHCHPEALLAAYSFFHSASLAIVHAIHIADPSRVNIIFIGSWGAPSRDPSQRTKPP